MTASLVGYPEVAAHSTTAHGHFSAVIDARANTIGRKLGDDALEGFLCST